MTGFDAHGQRLNPSFNKYMTRRTLIGLAVIAFQVVASPAPAWAKGSRGHSAHKSSSHSKPTKPAHVKAEKPKRIPSIAPARSVPRTERAESSGPGTPSRGRPVFLTGALVT
jgi:hypothetical protein